MENLKEYYLKRKVYTIKYIGEEPPIIEEGFIESVFMKGLRPKISVKYENRVDKYNPDDCGLELDLIEAEKRLKTAIKIYVARLRHFIDKAHGLA